MLRLPGEDAIVSWPNAKETIIDARDAFMARTIFAAATGIGFRVYHQRIQTLQGHGYLTCLCPPCYSFLAGSKRMGSFRILLLACDVKGKMFVKQMVPEGCATQLDVLLEDRCLFKKP